VSSPGGSPQITVQRLRADAVLPSYAHPGDAGADVCAVETITLAPGERAAVPTGLAVAIPEGYACFVHPRSGLALKHGVTMINAPGTIDAGYRGELKVLVVNLDPRDTVTLHAGDRIAQLVVQPVAAAGFVEVPELPDSARGAGGFGSTGGFGARVGSSGEAGR
jgi:dUTP pyrophosphatase